MFWYKKITIHNNVIHNKTIYLTDSLKLNNLIHHESGQPINVIQHFFTTFNKR